MMMLGIGISRQTSEATVARRVRQRRPTLRGIVVSRLFATFDIGPDAMSASRRKSLTTPERRAAMTLLEVLLALSLLVMLAALAWPLLTSPLANQRLRSAADTVRTEWAEARVLAISTGRIYAFQCVPGQNRFTVTPMLSLDAATADASTDEAADPLREGSSDAPEEHFLPERTQFAAIDADSEGRQAGAVAANALASSLDAANASTASSRLMFYPDGTTTSGVVRIEGEHGRTISLTLRGLTGVATVSPIEAVGEGGSP
jgi:type II secretory pathway pseudopilin PulG